MCDTCSGVPSFSIGWEFFILEFGYGIHLIFWPNLHLSHRNLSFNFVKCFSRLFIIVLTFHFTQLKQCVWGIVVTTEGFNCGRERSVRLQEVGRTAEQCPAHRVISFMSVRFVSVRFGFLSMVSVWSHSRVAWCQKNYITLLMRSRVFRKKYLTH